VLPHLPIYFEFRVYLHEYNKLFLIWFSATGGEGQNNFSIVYQAESKSIVSYRTQKHMKRLHDIKMM